MASTLGAAHPFRYRGYYYDAETGLYYLNSRYYNPEWGRFINADSYGGSMGAFLSHNVFAYCANNPIMHSDPSGNREIICDDANGRPVLVRRTDNFLTMNAAAKYWANVYGAESIAENKEKSALIYKNGNRFELGKTNSAGTKDSSTLPTPEKGKVVAGYIHSHGAYDASYGDGNFVFSIAQDERTGQLIGDIPTSYNEYLNSNVATNYIATPNGWLQSWTWTSDSSYTVKLVSASMPYDLNCPAQYSSTSYWSGVSDYYNNLFK